MFFQYLLIFAIGFLWALAAMVLARRFVLKHKLLYPKGIPLIGGIVMGISFFITSFLVFYPSGISFQLKGVLAACGIMLVLGAIDDIREVSVASKIVFQVLVTSFVVVCGVRTNIVYIGDMANLAITFIWIIGITNAFNLLDISDGLAGSTALLVGLSFFVISWLTGDIAIARLIICLLGGVGAFLLYNFPPAKVYMGNSGSHFLGFFFGVIAIIINYAPMEKTTSLLSPVFILGFPVFDTLFIIWVRLSKKRHPFEKTNDHLAMRLAVSGYPPLKTLFVMLRYCFLFCCGGVILFLVNNMWGLLIIALLFWEIVLFTARMNKVVVDG